MVYSDKRFRLLQRPCLEEVAPVGAVNVPISKQYRFQVSACPAATPHLFCYSLFQDRRKPPLHGTYITRSGPGVSATISKISDALTLYYVISTNKGAFSGAPTFILTPDTTPDTLRFLQHVVKTTLLKAYTRTTAPLWVSGRTQP